MNGFVFVAGGQEALYASRVQLNSASACSKVIISSKCFWSWRVKVRYPDIHLFTQYYCLPLARSIFRGLENFSARKVRFAQQVVMHPERPLDLV